MATHTCKPDHEGVLADDCERCAEHAATPMLLNLDQHKTRALWAEMLAVEYGVGNGNDRGYRTQADRTAGHQLYCLSLWLERFCGIPPLTITTLLGREEGS